MTNRVAARLKRLAFMTGLSRQPIPVAGQSALVMSSPFFEGREVIRAQIISVFTTKRELHVRVRYDDERTEMYPLTSFSYHRDVNPRWILQLI